MSKWAIRRREKALQRVKWRKTSMPAILKRFFNLNENHKVLDIGCGQAYGIITMGIAKECKEAIGIDIDEEWINKAKELSIGQNNVKFMVVDAQEMPFDDEEFDIVCCTETIEHIASPKKMLSEIYRVLKKGGSVYLTTPNKLWPIEAHYELPFLSYLPKRMAEKYIKFTKREMKDEYNIQLFTYFRLKKIIQRHGFQIENISMDILKDANEIGLIKQDKLPLGFFHSIFSISPTFIREVSYLFFPMWFFRLKKG